MPTSRPILLFLSACLPVIAGPVAAAEKIYWTDRGSSSIHRSNLDGTNSEILISSGLDGPAGIAVDSASLKMYWVEEGGHIRRADLNGSTVENLLFAGGEPTDIVLDQPPGKMYWTERAATRIRKANLDGTDAEDVIDTLFDPYGIDLDRVAKKIYWVEGSAAIMRANLDGTQAETEWTDNGLVRDVAVDPTAERLYWSNSAFLFIAVADLTILAQFLDILQIGSPRQLALSSANGKIYWTAGEAPVEIARANLDGTGRETLVSSGLSDPEGIALGPDQPMPPLPQPVPASSAWSVLAAMSIVISLGLAGLRDHRNPAMGGIRRRIEVVLA